MLNRGRMEGWARIRISGQTDWKRVWMVVCAATEGERTSNEGNGPGSPPTLGVAARKKRMSNLFAREASPQRSGPSKASFTMFASQKVKDKKKALLTMTDITQAFAVYPERPELISRSTLIKVEGHIGIEDTAAGMRNREGWVLVMPELEPEMSQATEMLKWVEGKLAFLSVSHRVSTDIIAFHDAFALYGRPQSWVWDPRSPTSLMFAYPVGPQKDVRSSVISPGSLPTLPYSFSSLTGNWPRRWTLETMALPSSVPDFSVSSTIVCAAWSRQRPKSMDKRLCPLVVLEKVRNNPEHSYLDPSCHPSASTTYKVSLKNGICSRPLLSKVVFTLMGERCLLMGRAS